MAAVALHPPCCGAGGGWTRDEGKKGRRATEAVCQAMSARRVRFSASWRVAEAARRRAAAISREAALCPERGVAVFLELGE